MPIETAATIYALGQLGQQISGYTARQREQSRRKRMALLGAEFSKLISAATDPKELSGIQLKANEISSLLEVPELAQQINNLGRLKTLQLSTAKKEFQAEQGAEFTKGAIGDISVFDASSKSYVPFSETSQFARIGELPIELQSEAYVSQLDILQKRVQEQVITTGEGYGLNIYDSSGKNIQSKLRLSADGTYDDITTQAIEKLDKPLAITQREEKDIQAQKQSNIIQSRSSRNPYKITIMQNAQGNPVPLVYNLTKEGKLTFTDLSGNEVTQEGLNELFKSKQKLPSDPYADPVTYKRWYDSLKLVQDKNASELLMSILSTEDDPKDELPDFYYDAGFGEKKLSDPTVSIYGYWKSGDMDRKINELKESENEIDQGIGEKLSNLKQFWFNARRDFEQLQLKTYRPKKKTKKSDSLENQKPGDNTNPAIPEFIEQTSDSTYSIY